MLMVMTNPASAQPNDSDAVEGPSSFLVMGVGFVSEYEGSDTLEAVPLIVGRTLIGESLFEVLGTEARLGNINRGGFSAGPVLGFTGGRGVDVDDSRVAQFAQRDPSFQLGFFGILRSPMGTLNEGLLELSGTLTDSLGGDCQGAKLVLKSEYSWAVTPFFRLAVGASVIVVNNDYADSRFGVSSADVNASGLTVYDPSSGVNDVSISVRSILSFSQKYGVFTRVAYTRLLDESADSPLVEQAGSADQMFFGAGLFVSFGR